MTQSALGRVRRPVFERRTFDETTVRYDGAALRFAAGGMIGRCSPRAALLFLGEVAMYADNELPALLAASVEGDRRGFTPGQVRHLASLFLGD